MPCVREPNLLSDKFGSEAEEGSWLYILGNTCPANGEE